MSEIWKDILGHEGRYQVSTTGRIKSLSRKVWCGKGYGVIKERILKLPIHKDGYSRIQLKAKVTQDVHVIILLTFKGPKPKGTEGIHLDGNPANNFEDNLEWGTPLKNQRMRIHQGTRHFTVEDILFIRQHGYDYKGIQTDLAKLYRVRLTMINRIVTRRRYNYVK